MGKRIYSIVLGGIFGLSLVWCGTALALKEGSPWTKLQRGAVNTTTGWLELFVQPVKGAEKESPFLGVMQGTGEGLLKGLQRTGLGLADSLSFPIGPYKEPVMEPETLFGEVH